MLCEAPVQSNPTRERLTQRSLPGKQNREVNILVDRAVIEKERALVPVEAAPAERERDKQVLWPEQALFPSFEILYTHNNKYDEKN